MSGDPVTVVVRLVAVPGKEARLGKLLGDLAAPTRSEPGCVSYFVHRAKDDPRAFVLYERWRSQGDLDLHQGTPYIEALRQEAPELLDGAPVLWMLEAFD